MKQSYPGIEEDISKWKGQEITDFQEDLRIRVNGQISEKWFYTHMKAENSSLPRIDVLDLLSQYAGYLNWQDFRHKNSGVLPKEENPGRKISSLLKMPLLLSAVMIVLFIVIKIINTQDYTFTFIDADTGEPITDDNLRIELLLVNESPVSMGSGGKGVISMRTSRSFVRMIVKAPYYLTDTVTRTLRKLNQNILISLHADYYALMVSYFSQSDVESWVKRREQLAAIISEDAIIYQFPEENKGSGMALYNKWEFIDKITMPASGLRQIEILDCRYLNGKISLLRFRIKTESE
ncbi:MAG: hypothetical protein V1903_06245 [Bacteroidota bacterium]